jgi:hypothetical protein
MPHSHVWAGPYLLEFFHSTYVTPDVGGLSSETLLSLDESLFMTVNMNSVIGLDALFSCIPS